MAAALKLRIPGEVRPLLAPVAILIAAGALAAAAAKLPPQLTAVRELTPYVVLLLATLVALWFNRGRSFIVAASLLSAYIGWRYAVALGPLTFGGKAVVLAILVLVPMNALIALLLPERGVVHHGAWRWLMLVALEVMAVSWLPAIGMHAPDAAYSAFYEHWLLRAPNPPLIARLMFCAAFAAAAWRAWPKLSEQGAAPLEIGVGGAMVGFLLAGGWIDAAGPFSVLVAGAGAVLLLAVMQESYRLAFRDELTGLPSRRALDERMRGLGPRYTIAMVDVDHFKKFNDTHGHDVGDQVLKLVAAQLARVEGGGRAYRYGGEEFTVLFEGQELPEVFPYLEKVRSTIEGYKMAVRSDDRPKSQKKGSKLRASSTSDAPAKMLSVTVSIGAAEKGENLGTPSEVVKAADLALYRAKEGGRNRVAR